MVSYSFRKITIIRQAKPKTKSLNKDLQWFSDSLGLFSERDKEKSCFRIFVELVKAARAGKIMSSDELAFKTNLSRATVIHHLNKLMESGLAIHEKDGYLLRVSNLENSIEELKRDVLRTLDDLKTMAEELDEQLGLLKRIKKPTKTLE